MKQEDKISFVLWLGIAVITIQLMLMYLITGKPSGLPPEFHIGVYGLLIGTLVFINHFKGDDKA